MPLINRKDILVPALLAASLLASAPAVAQSASKSEPLVIQEQGSFAVGGTVTTAPGTFDPLKPLEPAGQTFRGDHVYAFYQVPVNPRQYPIVMWHGAGQFSKTWETTPDGREGFQNIFLRRRFATYLIDQPRRGNAGRSTVEATIKPTPDEQLWFNQFRVGIWPNYFDGVQFDRKPETLNQYFRAMTPNTGPFDMNCPVGWRVGAVRQDRRRHPVHAFAGRRSRLADRDQEPERQGDRLLRARQQLHFPGGRGAARRSRAHSTRCKAQPCPCRSSWR